MRNSCHIVLILHIRRPNANKVRKAPDIIDLNSFKFPAYQSLNLENGIPLYQLDTKNKDVFKMDICFQGGRIGESQKLSGRAAAYLIREGTQKYSSEEIAEITDYYGATIMSKSGMDFNTLSLYCLKRQLKNLLPVIADILSNALIPEEELQRYIRTQKQHLKIQLSKNDVIAYREFSQDVMGISHPYGYNSIPEFYDQIAHKDVMSFYKKHYVGSNARIFISCNWDSEVAALIEEYLGQTTMGQKPSFDIKEKEIHNSTGIKNVDGPQPMQSALRIGRRMFSRKHPDYCKFYMLNTVFGGYFGSRLMENIREDKGYSYGIYSYLDCMRFDGYFSISTECNAKSKDLCIEEVRKEMTTLREDLIPDTELKMVKNYLLGNFMSMVDGPFNTLAVLKTLVNTTDSVEIFNELIRTILNSTPQEMRDIAQKYLDPQDMYYVSVG